MEDNYWITDDEWLIFKPEFNEPLDNYYDVINKYPKIIFSDYNRLQDFFLECISKYCNR